MTTPVDRLQEDENARRRALEIASFIVEAPAGRPAVRRVAAPLGRHQRHHVVQQAALADRLGFDFIWFTEHHFVADGYLPAFQPVAGAVAAVTERIRISNDIALLPLYHPIRLAEEIDRVLASMIADGTLDAIIEQWL